MRIAKTLGTALAALVIAGCGAESSSASTARADGAGNAGGGDVCAHWIGEVRALCAAYVEGGAVDADCTRHAGMVLNTLPNIEGQPAQVRSGACQHHLDTLLGQRADGSARRDGVEFTAECRELATVVKRNCVDTLATGADAMQCQAQLSAIATARSTQGEQQSLGCAVYKGMLPQ
jgi:hypothetical protein